MLLVSGLGLGSSHADSMLGLQLLIDMVTGQLGDQGEQSGAATISRVLLAGNLLSHNTQDKDASTKVVTDLTLVHVRLCIYVYFGLSLHLLKKVENNYNIETSPLSFSSSFKAKIPDKEDSSRQCGGHPPVG